MCMRRSDKKKKMPEDTQSLLIPTYFFPFSGAAIVNIMKNRSSSWPVSPTFIHLVTPYKRRVIRLVSRRVTCTTVFSVCIISCCTDIFRLGYFHTQNHWWRRHPKCPPWNSCTWRLQNPHDYFFFCLHGQYLNTECFVLHLRNRLMCVRL